MNHTRNEKLVVSLGKRVRELRERQGKSLADISIECEIEKQLVYLIEHGKVNTSVSTIDLIARALNVSLSELFKDL